MGMWIFQFINFLCIQVSVWVHSRISANVSPSNSTSSTRKWCQWKARGECVCTSTKWQKDIYFLVSHLESSVEGAKQGGPLLLLSGISSCSRSKLADLYLDFFLLAEDSVHLTVRTLHQHIGSFAHMGQGIAFRLLWLEDTRHTCVMSLYDVAMGYGMSE